MSARENAIQLFNTAVAAVQPQKLIPDHLFIDDAQQLHIFDQSFSLNEIQNIYLIGSGKASAAMAKAVQDILGDLITAGLVVTKYGHSVSLKKIICLEAAHPVPDQQGIEATMATIQLLQYAPDAHWFSFIISDVPDNDLAVIASGPTVPDQSTFDDCLSIITKYDLSDKLPDSVYQRLVDGCKGIIQDTYKKQHPVFERVINQIIGNNLIALKAAESKAIELGYHISTISSSLTGDAEKVGRSLIDFSKSYQGVKPACILLGGETTVKVTGNGIGGRNQQMALTALDQLATVGENNFSNKITFLSAGTDGTDGPTDAAGAIVDGDTVSKTSELKLDIAKYLLNNDAYTFFSQSGGLLKTGATQTNVMDLVILLIE